MKGVKSIINGDARFLCELNMRTVNANFCFKVCGDGKGECNVPVEMRLALIRHNENYTPYFIRNDETIHFRIHSLMGKVCIKELILNVLKPLTTFPSIDFLNKTEKGKSLHTQFRTGYEIHSIELIYEEEIEGIKFAIHGEVDYYSTINKSIDDLKTTEWMPSYSNKNGKDRDIEQIQLYDGLNQKGRVVKYFDDNDLTHTDLDDDYDNFRHLDVESLRLIYYNTAQTNPRGTLGDFFEPYNIERNLELFERKLLIVREAIGYLSEYKKTGVLMVPKIKCKNKKCNYWGVVCK